MTSSASQNPLRPAILCLVIGTFLLLIMTVVMTGQANGIHGDCHDASWYCFSAVFLPAATIIAVLFTTVALYAGVICVKRAVRFGRRWSLLWAAFGLLMCLGSLGGLAHDLYSIRDLFLSRSKLAASPFQHLQVAGIEVPPVADGQAGGETN